MPDALRSSQRRSQLLHEVNRRHLEQASFAERIADLVVAGMGSWRFLIVQTTVIVLWVSVNMGLAAIHRWDPYPFILMNLCLSLQAAYAAPLILLSQKRSAERDRLTLEHAAHESEEDRLSTERLRRELAQQHRDLMTELKRRS